MTDLLNMSWSFSSSASEQGSSPARWLFDECFEHPLPPNEVLLVSQRTGRRAIVSTDVSQALKQCRRFRSLDDHYRHLAAVFPNVRGHRDDVMQVLNQVSGTGLMVSSRLLAEELWAASAPAGASSGAVVCIPTCDRPPMLARLLEALPVGSASESDVEYLVIDDSRNAENRRRNRDIVAERASATGWSIRYVGDDEQQALIRALIDALPEHRDAIGFLLEPDPDRRIVSHGRVRNVGLLLAAGRFLLFLDDDVLPLAYPPPIASIGGQISSKARAAAFFSDDEAWQGFMDRERLDPLQPHLDLLGESVGRTLSRIVSPRPDEAALSELTSTDLTDLHAGSRVLITASGSYGDPGLASNYGLYCLEGDSLRRLLVSEAFYRGQLDRGRMWLGAAEPRILPHYHLLSQLTGLDNRALLPPYFPRFRNEDYLFGAMTKLMHPDSVMVDLPMAIPHLPNPARAWKENAVDAPAWSGMLDVTADCVGGARRRGSPTNPEARLDLLAAQLIDQAALSESRLGEWLTNQVLHRRAGRIQRWRQLLQQEPDAPDYWRRDLERGIQNNLQSLPDARGLLLKDLPEGVEPNQAPAFLRGLWTKFGLSLRAWPDIRLAAARIRSRA